MFNVIAARNPTQPNFNKASNKKNRTETITIPTPPQPSLDKSSEETASDASNSKRRRKALKFYGFKTIDMQAPKWPRRQNTACLIQEIGIISILPSSSTLQTSTNDENLNAIAPHIFPSQNSIVACDQEDQAPVVSPLFSSPSDLVIWQISIRSANQIPS